MGILRDVTLHFIRQCFPALFNRLHISLSRGHVDSTDIALSKSDPFSVCGIPWQVIDGKLSGLSLQLPWMNRQGAKFSITIKSVHIHLVEVPFPCQQELVFAALKDEMCREKFRFVAEAERSQAPFGHSVRDIVSQVFERIDLHMEDCTAKVEFADGFIAIFHIAKLVACRSELSSAESSRTFVVSIQGISANVKSSSRDGTVSLNIPDVSISIVIELDQHALKVDFGVSRILDILVHFSLRECVHNLNVRRMQWWSAQKWCRPNSCVRTDPASWVRYAYRRVSASHGLQQVQFDDKIVRRSLRSFVEYKNLHVKRLNKARLKTEEIDRIAELEKIFDADLILLLRHAAKQDVAEDEVSQFGKSEWLGWILFGHRMSSERERLTAHVRQSLELSTGQAFVKDSIKNRGGGDQTHCERYEFQCGINRLSGRLKGGTDELQILLTNLGLRGRLHSETGYYNIELSLEDLLFSVDENVVVGKQRFSTTGPDGNDDKSLMFVSLVQSLDGISSHVNLHSISIVLEPRIIYSCSSLLQEWTLPLLPKIFDRQDYQTQGCTQDEQSRSLNVAFADVIFTVRNTHLLFFDDRIIYGGKSPALSIALKKATIRQPPSIASFTPEFDISLSLQGSEFDVRSPPKYFAVPVAGDSLFPCDRQQFVSISTHFCINWAPTARMSFGDTVGFICVPVTIRVISKMWTSCSFQVVDASSAKGDKMDAHTIPGASLATSSLQERFLQGGLEVTVPFLKIDIMRGPQPLHHVCTLEMKQWEIALSSPSFLLVSVRIGNIHLSSNDTRLYFILIEPTSQFQYAFYLKRRARPQIGRRLYEVLIGDVSSQLSSDVVLAATTLISESVDEARNIPRTAGIMSSPEAKEVQTTALLSLLAASLKLHWSDGEFQAEFKCSDFQVVAEGDKISGSAETITLTEMDARRDASVSATEIILYATDPVQAVKSALRFIFEPTGLHMELNNLTAYAKRSFWDPLVSSVVHILGKLEERDFRKRLSNSEILNGDDKSSPITFDGSSITVILSVPKPEQPLIFADISRVIVDLRSGFQRLSFRRTGVLIRHLKKPRRTEPEESVSILQAADFDIHHRHKLSRRDMRTLVHYSDNWELNVPNSLVIGLSPKSLLALWVALSQLFSPSSKADFTKASPSRTSSRTCGDSLTAVVEKGRILFHGSVKSARLSFGIEGRDAGDEPFAQIDVKDICLSTAEVHDSLTADSCDTVVFTWLVSCSTFHVFQYQRYSSDPGRIAIGEGVRKLFNYASPHRHRGMSVRVVSRRNHELNTMMYQVRINDISVIYDPDLYKKTWQFTAECLSEVSTLFQDNTRESRETQDKTHDGRHRKTTMMSDPSRTPEISFRSSWSEDQRITSRCMSSAKVAVVMTNVNLLCLSDEARDSGCRVTFQIRKLGAALVLSDLMQPMDGSKIRLEGISFCVNVNSLDTRRFSAITGGQSLEKNSYAAQEYPKANHDCEQMPHSFSTSAQMKYPNSSKNKLFTTIGSISAALKRSDGGVMILSVGKVSLDTSVQTLLSLTNTLSRYGLNSPTGAQTLSDNSVIAPSRLRLQMQLISVRLSVDLSSNVNQSETPPSRGSMRADVNISVHSLIDFCSQRSQGTVKLSVDISDYKSGHRDPFVSPTFLRYQITKEREFTIVIDIRQLLRISFSPLTLRMAFALNAAMQSSRLVDSSSARPGTDSRVIVEVHGMALRCLSEVPRIQILRLLLGKIKFDAVLTVTSANRILNFSIQEFLLEDTISWRLFRSDPTDPSSRRWERIVTSAQHVNVGSSPQSSISAPDVQAQDMHSYNTSLPQHNNLSTRPALRCRVAWYDYFEDFKARIDSSGVDINLDLVALPVIQEWFGSLVQELRSDKSPKLGGQDDSFASGESEHTIQRGPWFSEIHLEALTLTGGVRAAPRRLCESLYERVLTYILDVDSVTGLALRLPAVHVRGQHGSIITLLRQVFATYSLATMTRDFGWQLLSQSQRLSRLARMFVVSLFRQRHYNPLRLSDEKTTTANASHCSVGLLAALDPINETNQGITEPSSFTQPLVVHRDRWTPGILRPGVDLQSSLTHVIDMTQ